MNTIELYESPLKSRNEKRYGDVNVCICCGKPLRGNPPAIHMNTAWEVVHPSISVEDCLEQTGHESQGYFDIGPECAKKMKDYLI